MSKAIATALLFAALLLVSFAPEAGVAAQTQSSAKLYVQPYAPAVQGTKGYSCPVVSGAAQSLCSLNWAGYIVGGTPGAVTGATGSWVTPSTTCPSTGSTYTAIWVGIDGFTDGTVEQAGTLETCNNGVANYSAWYEFYPNPMVRVGAVDVQAGSVVGANVTYDGVSGNFTVSLSSSTGGSFSVSQNAPFAQLSSAEWIVERPALCVFLSCQLTSISNFGTADLGLDFTGAASSNLATIGGTTAPFGSFSTVAVTMAGSAKGPTEALPGQTSTDGTSFRVTEPFGSANPTVAVSCNAPSVTVGKKVRCTATVSGDFPTGLVSWSSTGLGGFSSFTCRLKKGSCSVTYKPLVALFPANLTAGYLGDGMNAASSGSIPLNVALKQSRLTISCRPGQAVAASTTAITCKAQVTGYYPFGIVTFGQGGNGTVAFLSNQCFLSKGSCFVKMVGESPGSVSIGASYAGDFDNLASVAAVNSTVVIRA